MAAPTLIHCASGNRRFAEIAINAGFKYGAQLPHTVYFKPYFADQNWREPDREAYMAALAEYRPEVATVLDLESYEQLDEVMDWFDEASQYVQTVVIIPKAQGIINQIPKRDNIRLGYSVPTKFAGTELPLWDFFGWPVHLLGGSPHRQMYLARYLNVKSVDGNMSNKMANRHCQFWVNGTARYASNRYWPTLKEWGNGIEWQGDNAHHEAFRRSCENIREAWDKLSHTRANGD